MDKEKLFSKLSSRDYNNQLEKILENKDFSENVKNLLLSMLYKIEVAYKDYEKVKIIVESKKIFIEEILEIIKEKCNKIVIVSEESEMAEELKLSGTKFLVDTIEGNIFLRYPNETLLLYTIYKMNDKQIYLDEKYNLIRNTFSQLLNIGENINNIEVLRDFNGWNWNTETKDIPELSINLIYQNLIYLLGIDFIKEWIHKEKVNDYLKLAENNIDEKYGLKNGKEILNLIYKISIIVGINNNKREKQRLLEEKQILQKERDRLMDKKGLLNEIGILKKQSRNRIKEIDNILNDRDLLAREFINRNEKRPEYNKILNIAHLKELLNKERKKELSNIAENNKLSAPAYFVEQKNKLEEQLELLKDIELDENEQNKQKRDYLLLLQKEFIKCFATTINKVSEKENIIKLIGMLRYYNLIYITKKEQIKDIEELQSDIGELEDLLLKKAYDLKIINMITNKEDINKTIIKKIFSTRIISLNNIGIKLKLENNNLEVMIYDGEIYEKGMIIYEFSKKDINIKLNKLVKLFN